MEDQNKLFQGNFPAYIIEIKEILNGAKNEDDQDYHNML
jgi:hypothetical protein